jgi:ATP-dependent Clp protease ATP-binding subunit ClpA
VTEMISRWDKSMDPVNLTNRHFSDSATRVVHHIADRAGDRGMTRGEFTEATVNMLAVLSILRWERRVARASMERITNDLDRMARELDELIEIEGRTSRRAQSPLAQVLPSGQRVRRVDFSTAQQSLLAEAEHQSMALGHNWVGTEHLLLGAVRLACPQFRQLLDRHGMTFDRVRESVVAILDARNCESS